MNILAQAIGCIGTVLFFISYQQKKKKNIMLFQIFGITMFTIHFFMLEAYSGFAMNLLGIIRAVVIYFSGRKWADSRVWYYGFMVSYVVLGIAVWEDWFSILPIIAMILSTYAFYLTDETKLRLLTFPCSPSWLIYNVHHGSISGTITECFTMTSLIIAMIRYDLPKLKAKLKKK